MPQSDHNEKHERLVKLLEQLPEVEDRRAMEKIHQQIRLRQERKKKKVPILIPAFSLVAAGLFFLLILPYFNQQSKDDLAIMNRASNKESQLDQEQRKIEESGEIATDKMDRAAAPDMASRNQLNMKERDARSAFYEGDANGKQVVTLPLRTKDAMVIPISIEVPSDESADRMEVLKSAAEELSELMPEAPSIEPLLQSLTINENERSATVVLDGDNIEFFNQNELLLMDMLQIMLQDEEVSVVTFNDPDGNPVELGHYGRLQPLDIKQVTRKGYFAYSPTGTDKKYLAPEYMPSASLGAAVEEMKQNPNDFFEPVLSKDMNLTIQEGENKELVTMEFGEAMHLDTGDEEANLLMIEALLLTAKEFGFQKVEFNNVSPLEWGQFDFQQPIDVPIAPNKLGNE